MHLRTADAAGAVLPKLLASPTLHLVPALTLTITHNSGNQAVLTWTADSAATGYLVLRSIDGRATYQVIASLPSSTLTYTDTTRPVGGTVYYHVVSTH